VVDDKDSRGDEPHTSSDGIEAKEGAEVHQGDRTVEPVLSPVTFNAVKHGILSVSPVLPGLERDEDWHAFRDSVFESIKPEGGLELAFADQVAIGLWRQMRLVRFEREVTYADQTSGMAQDLRLEAIRRKQQNTPTELTPEVEALLNRSLMRRLIPSDSTLTRIIRYHALLRREVGHALRNLEALKKERKAASEMTLVREVFRAFGPRSSRALEGDDLLQDAG
jgi:hypothetical protein